MIVTLHLGPMSGDVLVSIAGKETRVHVNATLLPDRTVLVTGGSQHKEQGAQATNHAEVFDPAHPERGWTELAAATVPRMYHSVALLLPDARVVTACGNPRQGTQVAWEPPDDNEELKMEVFSPPYLDPSLGPRPRIGAAGRYLGLGSVRSTMSTLAIASSSWL